MQTFLPYPNFEQSAMLLDRKRLGKQRLEAKQILTALCTGKGWIHHPATKMWTGYEFALIQYGIEICKEWINRGYNDSILPQFHIASIMHEDTGMPPWMGDELFHESHRSKLMMKDPEYYSFQDTRENLPYIWPVLTETGYIRKIGK